MDTIKVYLCGNISENPETYEWRKEVSRLVTSRSYGYTTFKFEIIDPCRNTYNQQLLAARHKDGQSFVADAFKIANGARSVLRAKDYGLIKGSNVMIVNLCFSSPGKPMIGTLHELCWAHDIFYIPVIGIIGSPEEAKDNIYATHPWIKECCSVQVATIEDAVDVLFNLFVYVLPKPKEDPYP